MTNGIPVETRDLQIEDLATADEAFFTGTAVEVTPIREIENHRTWPNSPGPITKKLADLYHAVTTGKDSRYHHWLRPVAG